MTDVIDAVTIEIESEGDTFRVKYLGVDNPRTGNGTGALSYNRFLVEGKQVTLISDASITDRGPTAQKYVFADGELINLKMLAAGWAIVADAPSEFERLTEFITAESSAKSSGLGVWALDSSNAPVASPQVQQGSSPSKGVTQNQPANSSGEVPAFGGTLPIRPNVDQSRLCDYSGTSDAIIKGKVNQSTGEKIYHIPGGRSYPTTVIDPSSGDRWFCTEREALSAGWDRSER